MSAGVEVRREGAVLVAAFARPEKKNAITGAMYEALIEAFDTAGRDPDIGALVLAGRGGVFTAGNDIADFLSFAASARDFATLPAARFIARLAEFEKPLLAAVDGLAVGVGTTLCFHCDLVYATPAARFHMPFVDLGLVPEAGSSLLVPQRFGRAKAAEVLMLAESFDGEAALGLGLVNALVPPEALLAHATAKAAALAAKPRSALMTTRRLLRGDPAALKARMAEEGAAFAAALASPEARAAFMAFMAGAKR
ncbi:enoyl-CoA hydratase/carnithine racemase [Roseiarcus fermentans]|uniref:Enoyl-CoA hydratase/carnithine racemase n=1 Tax=Roseiarcus fermentans TaxID=1473586 RepID=A0A366FVV9_9HYPH|nr:enoyl-CoA hydratase-related protein [Roseiarcus fermentans]RBP18276.1 enoyl-CoA hydratase/carnithine racemase [Roseiarcus fermentans]